MRKPFLLWIQCQISTDDGCQYKKREMLQGFGTQLYLQGHIYSQLEMPHDFVWNEFHIRPCGHTFNACRYLLLKSLYYDKTQTLEQVETLRVILNGLPHRVTNRSENQKTSGMLKKTPHSKQAGWEQVTLILLGYRRGLLGRLSRARKHFAQSLLLHCSCGNYGIPKQTSKIYVRPFATGVEHYTNKCMWLFLAPVRGDSLWKNR